MKGLILILPLCFVGCSAVTKWLRDTEEAKEAFDAVLKKSVKEAVKEAFAEHEAEKAKAAEKKA